MSAPPQFGPEDQDVRDGRAGEHRDDARTEQPAMVTAGRSPGVVPAVVAVAAATRVRVGRARETGRQLVEDASEDVEPDQSGDSARKAHEGGQQQDGAMGL